MKGEGTMKTKSEFKIKISMGNDAMQTSDDVVTALKQVIKKLESGRDGGNILDENGNNVGNFDFTED